MRWKRLSMELDFSETWIGFETRDEVRYVFVAKPPKEPQGGHVSFSYWTKCQAIRVHIIPWLCVVFRTTLERIVPPELEARKSDANATNGKSHLTANLGGIDFHPSREGGEQPDA